MLPRRGRCRPCWRRCRSAFRSSASFWWADRGLLSLGTIDALTARAAKGKRQLEFILAGPVRRYAELAETFRALAFDDTGLAEARFAATA